MFGGAKSRSKLRLEIISEEGRARPRFLAQPMHYQRPVNAMNTNAGYKKEKKAGSGGFTLLQLVVAIAVVTILVSVALPNLARARQNAEDTRTEKELQSIYTAIVMFETANGRRPASWFEMRNYIPIQNIEGKYELNTQLG